MKYWQSGLIWHVSTSGSLYCDGTFWWLGFWPTLLGWSCVCIYCGIVSGNFCQERNSSKHFHSSAMARTWEHNFLISMPSTHYHILSHLFCFSKLCEYPWQRTWHKQCQELYRCFLLLSAFLHVHSSNSAEAVIIAHFSGGRERCFLLALDTYELLLATLSPNGL